MLSRLNARTQSPFNAVAVFFTLVLCLLMFGQIMDWAGVINNKPFNGDAVDFYGFLTVCGIMLLTIFSSAAAFMLPAKYPKQYQTAYLRFPKPVLYGFIFISILTSLPLVAFMFFSSALIASFYIVLTILITGYYFYRKKQLAQQGIAPGTTHDILSEN